MRKYYLDNVRWATILIVLLYHVFYMFNDVGILGGIPDAKNIPAFDQMACIIYPWFMVLLFVIAGMSARYALQNRTGKQFIKERAVKLLIPSTLGLFVVHWITGYLNIKLGGGLEFIPKYLLYPISAISGIGPLWFIQLLFLFSCILILFRTIDKSDKLWMLCKKANLPFILLLSVLIYGSAQVLNAPVFTFYRFGIYFIAFLIGYYIFSHDEVQDMIEKIHIPMACLSVIGAILYGIRYGGSDYTSPVCLQNILTNIYLWVVVLAVLGCGKRYFNCETVFSRYLTKSSFGIYILHYPILLVICYILQNHFTFPAICNYTIALVLDVIITFAGYEVIKRIPMIRYLVLGMKKESTKVKTTKQEH